MINFHLKIYFKNNAKILKETEKQANKETCLMLKVKNNFNKRQKQKKR